MKKSASWIVLLSALFWSTQGQASIYVIDAGYSHPMVVSAKSYLTNLGYTLVNGNTLSDYTPYEQVWDLRFNTALVAADQAAMGNYLTASGRMYFAGEHSGFDVRNNSLVGFVSVIGGGALTLQSASVAGAQPITAAGAVVDLPNVFSSVGFSGARTASIVGNGFLVTETTTGSGQGSLLGWDFGDIVSAATARMLIGFDIEIFQAANGQNWTEDMATYLGGSGTPTVPEPSTVVIWSLLGAVGLSRCWWRRKRMP